MKNVLIAQSGGPTAVINSSLVGIFEKASSINDKITVYGSMFGVDGVLNDNIVNLTSFFKNRSTKLLLQTPGSFLGSCRTRLPEIKNSDLENSIYKKIFETFKKHQIKWFFYIGGNDSMETVWKLATFFKLTGLNEIKIIGVPKTIDNDLEQTDHCPGFGSAAKFVATTFAELNRDCSVYSLDAVTVVEVMGRDAGWLTASSALARLNGCSGPDLIYCCEKPFSVNNFLNDVQNSLKKSKYGRVLVAVSEGIKLSNSKSTENLTAYFDEFGHVKNAGVAEVLAKIVSKNIGCKVRSIELSLLQRASAHIASKTDVTEAQKIGAHAVCLASQGYSGVMATIERKSNDPYVVNFSKTTIEKVIHKTKTMPLYFLSKNSADVTSHALEYLKPLIQGELELEMTNGLPKHLFLNY